MINIVQKLFHTIQVFLTTGKNYSKAVGLFLDPMVAENWQIGPIVHGENFSTGMPEHPSQALTHWFMDFPQPNEEAGSINYVTMLTGPLNKCSKVSLTYEITADPGVKILPRKYPEGISSLSLYFQRLGDGWGAKDEAYRWYASFATQRPLTVGVHTVEATFDQNWTAVLSSSKEKNPQVFADALESPVRIGFVLGGGDGLGHGVYATGPARLTVLSFKVE